jgi:hypothetical protein
LLRCWTTEERDSFESIDERFVVERVSDEPHRWVFSTFADLVDFLRAELLGEEPGGQHQSTPPDA